MSKKYKNDKIKNENLMENYYELNKIMCMNMYGTFKEPEKKKYFVDNYIADNKNAMKELESSLSIPGSTILFSAPTGSGKTTAIKTVFDNIKKKYENDKDTIVMCIFGQPTRAIAEQLAEDYQDIVSIVGDEKNPRYFSLTQSMIYAVVLEKMKDAKKAASEIIESGKKVIIILVVDECQHITTAQFRDGAVKETLELAEIAKANDGSVGFMTATSGITAWLKADKYIFAEYSNSKAKFDELNLFVNNQEDRSYVDFVYDCVMTKDQKGFIRINDKRKQNQLEEKFSLANKKVCKVCGDDKDFFLDEHGHPIYLNQLMNDVVRHGKLPDCDIALATCMFDAGENIKGIGEKGFQDSDFCAWYCMASTLDASIVSIIQYANRMRYHFKSYNIITFKRSNNEKKIPFQSLESLIPKQVAKCKRDMKHIEEFIKNEKKYLVECGEYEEESFEKRINNYLSFSELEKGTDLSYGGAIEYKKGELVLHVNFLYGFIARLYDLQFYFDQDLLIAKLENTFGMKVNVIENVESYSCPSGKDVEDVKTELLKLSNDPRFIMNWTDEEYKEITRTAVFDDIMYLRELGMNFKEAIQTKCTLNDKELDELKTKKIQERLRTFSDDEIKIIDKLICKNIKLSDCITQRQREKMSIIMRYDPYVKKLRKLLNVGIPIERAVQIPIKDIQKETKQYQIIQVNKIYKQDRNSPFLKTSVNQVQRIILDYVVDDLKFDVNGKNRIKLTDERLEDLCKRIYDLTGRGVEKKKVKRFVKMIFKTWNRTVNKEKVLELIELQM